MSFCKYCIRIKFRPHLNHHTVWIRVYWVWLICNNRIIVSNIPSILFIFAICIITPALEIDRFGFRIDIDEYAYSPERFIPYALPCLLDILRFVQLFTVHPARDVVAPQLFFHLPPCVYVQAAISIVRVFIVNKFLRFNIIFCGSHYFGCGFPKYFQAIVVRRVFIQVMLGNFSFHESFIVFFGRSKQIIRLLILQYTLQLLFFIECFGIRLILMSKSEDLSIVDCELELKFSKCVRHVHLVPLIDLFLILSHMNSMRSHWIYQEKHQGKSHQC